MASITVQPELLLERILSLEIVRVTERAAVSAARLRGHGKDKASDQAAVDAMRRELNKLPIDGTALCAKNMAGAIATIAMDDAGTLLHAPDCYMQKIAIGPGYPKGVIDLDAPADENITALAKAKGVKPSEITAILLDRPRHADIIEAVRKTGAAVSLISDGDVAGVIHCAEPKTGIDIYLGIGGAPEGVLAAAALRCIGGQMQTRLIIDTEQLRDRTLKMGIKDPKKKYNIEDMVKGDCLFAATGVTSGPMLAGVKFGKDVIETETVVMRSATGTVRRVIADHRQFDKFHMG